jgi:hypothetical protein
VPEPITMANDGVEEATVRTTSRKIQRFLILIF